MGNNTSLLNKNKKYQYIRIKNTKQIFLLIDWKRMGMRNNQFTEKGQSEWGYFRPKYKQGCYKNITE